MRKYECIYEDSSKRASFVTPYETYFEEVGLDILSML